MTSKFGSILAAFVAAASVTSAAQAEQWPSRPITIISPYPPGGTNDIVGRLFADKMSAKLGQAVIVENKPGAAGLIGSRSASRAPADGYTFLIANNGALIIQPLVNEQAKLDPNTDFTPIFRAAVAYQYVGVTEKLPVKTMSDLVALAKKEPGKLFYGSSGSGSFGQFSGEMLQFQTGTKLTHVPYRGSAQALTGLIAGEIQVMFDPLVLSQSQGGRVRVLAGTSPHRIPEYPEIPTMKEAGFPDYDPAGWFAFFGPPGLPKAIVDKFAQVAAEVAKDPAIASKLQSSGLAVSPMMPDEFAPFIENYMRKYQEIKRQANIPSIK